MDNKAHCILLHFLQCSPETISFQIMVCSFFLNMVMPLQIFKVFYIFVLSFQVVLSIIEKYLVVNHCSRTIYLQFIITAPCPRGDNRRNPQQHGPNVSGIKGSRHKDVLHSSRYTTHPPLNIPLVQLKTIVPTNISHSQVPSYRKFFIKFTCGIQVSYIATN